MAIQAIGRDTMICACAGMVMMGTISVALSPIMCFGASLTISECAQRIPKAVVLHTLFGGVLCGGLGLIDSVARQIFRGLK